jgi:hypothetical protein
LLDLPEGRRFDASALLRMPSGEFWTINDQAAGVYRISVREETNSAQLIRIPEILTSAHRMALLGSPRSVHRLDCEGLARGNDGRIYLTEEGRRWILCWNPAEQTLTRLNIDWSPVSRFFHPTDINASFEGIAVGGEKLYVANERQSGRIIAVDLPSLRVIDDFAVAPSGSPGDDTHYTDLCWAESSLWVLLRDQRKVLRVDPLAKRVLAEFDYTALETDRRVAYGSFFAPGFMEGLAVDDAHVWLLSDNNGWGRRVNDKDTRPTLFRCPRPDR